MEHYYCHSIVFHQIHVWRAFYAVALKCRLAYAPSLCFRDRRFRSSLIQSLLHSPFLISVFIIDLFFTRCVSSTKAHSCHHLVWSVSRKNNFITFTVPVFLTVYSSAPCFCFFYFMFLQFKNVSQWKRFEFFFLKWSLFYLTHSLL